MSTRIGNLKALNPLLLAIFMLLAHTCGIFVPLPHAMAATLPGRFQATVTPDTSWYTQDPSQSAYDISSADQLAGLALLVNDEDEGVNFADVVIRLTADIDLSAYGVANDSFNDNRGWLPIGHSDDSSGFQGTFDGQGHTISGLSIDSDEYDNTGLFGWVNNGTIQNLTLDNAYVSGGSYVGGFVGYLEGSIENCTFRGEVLGDESVGGIVGLHESGAVSRCHFMGELGGSSDIGGIIGRAYFITVDACTSSGSLYGSGEYTGGIVGRLIWGSITNSLFQGNVYSENYAGGLVGYLYDGSLLACYATGRVEAERYAGGLVGSSDEGTIEECIALNSSVEEIAVDVDASVGRIVGENFGLLSRNHAWSGMLVAQGGKNKVIVSHAESSDGLSQNASELQFLAAFPAAFAQEPWVYLPGYLPGLGAAAEMPAYLTGLIDTSWYEAQGGTTGELFTLRSARELAGLAYLVNNDGLSFHGQTIQLLSSIDLSDYGSSNLEFNSGLGWIPIGSPTTPFSGIFNGNKGVITGLYLVESTSSNSHSGLFGYIDGGTVHSLGLSRVSLSGGTNTGGMVGELSGTLQDCYVMGSINGLDNTGGLVGILNTGNITNCYSTAAVTGKSSVGGIAGHIITGTVAENAGLNTSVTATASASSAGRIAGSNTAGTLKDNTAFADTLLTIAGSSRPPVSLDNGSDGASKSVEDLQEATGYPQGLTTAPWVYAPYKLPGLSAPLAMPAHLHAPGTPDTSWYEAQRGQAASTYNIVTADQLAGLAELVNEGTSFAGKTINLTADIDLLTRYGVTRSRTNNGAGWIPIGHNDNHPFRGNFDGGGHVISGLGINSDEYDNTGLFGWVNGGSLTNLGLAEVNIVGGSSTGGLVGYISGQTTIKNCYVTGAVKGADNTGGIVGQQHDVTMIGCYSTARVEGTRNVGGLAGGATGSSVIENSAALNNTVAALNAPVGRVVGNEPDIVLANNIAYEGMAITIDGEPQEITTTGTPHGVDGEGKSLIELQLPHAFPSIFTSSPWVYEEGKLPGLGQAAAMPPHLVSDVTALEYEALLTDVTVPVAGEAPQSSIIMRSEPNETLNFTSRLAWYSVVDNEHDTPFTGESFLGLTTYQAVVTLTANSGWTWDEDDLPDILVNNKVIPSDAIVVTGKGSGNSLSFWVTYPATGENPGLQVGDSPNYYTTVASIKNAIETELAKPAVTSLTIRGSLKGVNSELAFSIPSGKQVVWQAEYSGEVATALLQISGAGLYISDSAADLHNTNSAGAVLLLSETAMLQHNGGTLSGSSLVLVKAGGDSLVFVANPAGLTSGKIHKTAHALAYYLGDDAALFASGEANDKFTPGIDLFQLDAVPTLKLDNTPYTYSHTPATSAITAYFPEGVQVTNINALAEPSLTGVELVGNSVVFSGDCDTGAQGLSLEVTATLAEGRLPVTFITQPFGLNIAIKPPQESNAVCVRVR